MLLQEYTTNKDAQRYLKLRCNLHAFTMNLTTSDVLSLAHYRIAIQIDKGKELNDSQHLFMTLKLIAYNAALDVKTNKANRYEGPTDPMLLPEVISSSHNLEEKELLRFVDNGIREFFACKNKFLEVHDYCIINGGKYEEAAKELDMPIGSVKNKIHLVRQYACQLRDEISLQ